MFKPVPSKVDFPRIEEDILKFWQEREIFRKTESEREGAPLFLLYEGPPTANGSPGIHHVLARVFKDVMPRYKTMKGFRAPRKGGWDTHGLPVELEVEKELGISTKQDIEAYGVENFNARCRESVFRYVKDWEDLTKRIGFWIDMKSAYVTCENDYIETAWWIIKQLWDRSLVYEGFRVAPHCPRCVTTLSSHEVALGYQENTPDPSVYVKFQVDIERSLNSYDGREAEPGARIMLRAIQNWRTAKVPVYLLAWTTTPWTLPGNTALAINADAEYALVRVEAEESIHIMASSLLDKVLQRQYQVIQRFTGRWLAGLCYQPLYNPFNAALPRGTLKRFYADVGLTYMEFYVGGGLTYMGSYPPDPPDYDVGMAEHSWQVHPADFVSMEDGTGIVHIAPAFGQDDYALGTKAELLFAQPVNSQGRIIGTYPFAGKFVKEADEDIMADLDKRGLLYRREVIRHTYPFCWRCNTPLLYYAKGSWYIKTTAVKDSLISGNQEINWYPDHIKEGRFGEWLRNNVDWALSRERYWGTPMPVWKCANCGDHECFGSVAALRDRAMPEHRHLLDSERLDIHRPYVDQVTLKCEKCGGTMRRIPDVMDAWFDSGAMPFAQAHVMSKDDLKELKERHHFPADFICEAVDQTRGWFYTLHALSTLIVGEPCYRNVICLGLILDAQGEKMSKSRGNVVAPWSVINAHGADALRWYLFTAAPPGNARRFSQELVGEGVRRFLLTLWNTHSFFVTYANIDRFSPSSASQAEPTSELDRWILSELNSLIYNVTRLMDGYNPTDAGRSIEEFVELLSNWYVRRSRRRFWKSENDEDKLSAYATLYRCLVTLSKLLAPFTPFVAEEIYQNLVRTVDPQAPESVHLATYPQADMSLVDETLSNATRLAMRLASLGRSARSKAQIKVRQPLARMLIKLSSPKEETILNLIAPQILDEVNVKVVSLLEDEAMVVEYGIKPNLPILGPKYGADVPRIASSLASLNPRVVAARVAAGTEIKAGQFTLSADDVVVSVADKPGYSVATEGGYTVAVVTELTDDLLEEGLARELVHRIQNMRRSAGFSISDHIVTYWQGDGRLREVIGNFGDYIRQETLSNLVLEDTPKPPAYVEEHKLDGLQVRLGVKQVQERSAP